MSKRFKAVLLITLFLLVFLTKESLSLSVNSDSLKKIDAELLRTTGETSVILEFSKKPNNYKSLIKSLGGRIERDYSSVNAVSIKINGEDISELANLQNIVRVHKNNQVKALLHDSAPLISANEVWNSGFTGKDVKVCVVDTGVDYTHPALGSCPHLVMSGNNESYPLENLPHPYPTSYNHVWTITEPGYTKIAVHFVNISVESGYDFIYVEDTSGNIVQKFTGDYRDVWSVSVPGDTIKISLTSDIIVNGYGFYVDKVLNGSFSADYTNCSKIIAGYNFINNNNNPMDDNEHGTHVTGIISSDDSYSRGIANGTKIMVAKVLDASGSGSDSDVIAGIDWCLNNSAQVISMSLGGDSYPGTCDDDLLAEAVNNAVGRGTVVVVAAGNSGQYGLSTPACASGAIAVGATDKNNSVVGFSSKGPELDLLAPGLDINSTVPAKHGSWRQMSGTSMAAPHVTGVVALMLEANPALSVFDIRKILNETSNPVNKCYECTRDSYGHCIDYYGTEIPCTRDVTGAGIVNALAAVNSVLFSDPRYYNVAEPADPSTYSPLASYKFSISWLGAIDRVTFEFNSTNYTDLEKVGSTYSKTLNGLPVGTYSYGWYANDTSNIWNSTNSLNFAINKATPTVSLTINPSTPITYETNSTVSCSASNPEAQANLYRNDSLANSENNTQTRLPAGTWNYTCNVTETQNYNSATASQLYVVSKKNANVKVYPSTQSITYGTPVSQYCTGDSLQSCNIYRNDILITNNTQYSPSAGVYVYKSIIFDTSNYTNYQDTETLTINKATPSLYVTFSPSSTVTYPTKTNATCSRIPGDYLSTLTLYRNGVQVAQGSGASVSEVNTLNVGPYNYFCNVTSTQNYAVGSSLNIYLTVQPSSSGGGGGGGCSAGFHGRGCLLI